MPHQGASAETLPPWGANDQIPTAVPGTQVFNQCVREGVRSQVPGTHPESPAPHFPAEHQSELSCSCSSSAPVPQRPRLLLVFCPALGAGEVPGPVCWRSLAFTSMSSRVCQRTEASPSAECVLPVLHRGVQTLWILTGICLF